MYLIGHFGFMQSPNKKIMRESTSSKETRLLLVCQFTMKYNFQARVLSTYRKGFVLHFLNLCQRVGHTKKRTLRILCTAIIRPCFIMWLILHLPCISPPVFLFWPWTKNCLYKRNFPQKLGFESIVLNFQPLHLIISFCSSLSLA